jgi:phosphoenolpyruvate carboxylase
VGGDKDGHPGVDEKVLLQSLNLSRQKLLKIFQDQLKEVKATLSLVSQKNLLKSVARLEKELSTLRTVRAGDGERVCRLRGTLNSLKAEYATVFGSCHPQIRRMSQLLRTFPGFVVPLELRESSDVLMSQPPRGKSLAIERMLATIAKISKGEDPRWYARGFIISMAGSLEHILAATRKQKAAFGQIRLPIIPLFEEPGSLAQSDQIMREMLAQPEIRKSAQKYWDSMVEMMVGYSDSSKEAGVLASRLAIAEALPKLEKVCEKARLTPVFFHGSGGSVDRGGGSIEDQTAWWPRSALARYKVTVQGEMVERSLATPEIAERQIEKIVESAIRGLQKKTRFVHHASLDAFAQKISKSYGEKIQSPAFLKAVEAATPYSYLNLLKIGSRPAKRSVQLTVKGLRAIPWVLCWTQTRVLFQTWWGVGSAWEETSAADKKSLKKAFREEPVFNSYVKALGFTLAKVEMPILKVYLDHSSLSAEEAQQILTEFKTELEKTVRFYFEICGKKDFMWFRPWLGESIQLRSPMIHPLNILQILAKKDHDVHLLRLTVTGISSGMLTTG